MDKNSDYIFSNIILDNKKSYLIYIGDFKYNNIPKFFIKPLRKYYNKIIEIIYIFPNYPPSYFKGQYVVVNHHINPFRKKDIQRCYYTISHEEHNRNTSESHYVKNLVKSILKNQDDLYINAFKDTPELTLHKDLSNIKLIGPSTKLFSIYDNKLLQHEMADILDIPQARWFLVPTKEDLIEIYSRHFINKPVFVSKLHSYSGKSCAIIRSKNELINHPHINKKNCKYIICEYLDIIDSPFSEAIVANEKEVFFLGVMDQLMDGVSYLGAVYPSNLNKDNQKSIEKYTLKIGKYLGKHGYRGFFGADFVIDSSGKLYFVEVNPRTCGSTTERIYMHESTKSKGMPSLPELELMAIDKGTFGNINVRKIRKANFSWGVFNIEGKKGMLLTDDILPKYNEEDTFKYRETTILDFPGKNVSLCNNGRLCRILSIKSTRKEVEKELNSAVKKLKKYIDFDD